MKISLQTYLNKPLAESVVQYKQLAQALFMFGVKYFDYESSTFEQVCLEHGVKAVDVHKKFEQLAIMNRYDVSLDKVPVPVLIHYLKDNHRIYIKEKLPYILALIEGINETNFSNQVIAKDLQFIFPVFIEDFIKHIYEEEDTLFSYILSLHQFVQNGAKHSYIAHQINQQSINEYAISHDHDHEMEGLRSLTNYYHISKDASVHEKIVLQELHQFDQELHLHAKIEDEILFLKGLQLEIESRRKLSHFTKLN